VKKDCKLVSTSWEYVLLLWIEEGITSDLLFSRHLEGNQLKNILEIGDTGVEVTRVKNEHLVPSA